MSIENQKVALPAMAEQGWTLYDYYCDDGVSGTTFDHPGLNWLVQDATGSQARSTFVPCKDSIAPR